MKIRKPSDRQEFNVVWRGRHYRLASLREHVRAEVYPAGSHYLLLDSLSRATLAPKGEVFIGDWPGQTDATA